MFLAVSVCLSVCIRIGGLPLQWGVVLKWFYSLSRRNTFVGGKCALPSALLVITCCSLNISRTQLCCDIAMVSHIVILCSLHIALHITNIFCLLYLIRKFPQVWTLSTRTRRPLVRRNVSLARRHGRLAALVGAAFCGYECFYRASVQQCWRAILIQQFCPSVCHVPVFYWNGLTYRHTFFNMW